MKEHHLFAYSLAKLFNSETKSSKPILDLFGPKGLQVGYTKPGKMEKKTLCVAIPYSSTLP